MVVAGILEVTKGAEHVDGGIEAFALTEPSHVFLDKLHWQPCFRGVCPSAFQILRGPIDTDDPEPAPSQLECVSAGTAAQVPKCAPHEVTATVE